MTRVQAGDLAVIVHPSNAGELVRIVQRSEHETVFARMYPHGGLVWWTCEAISHVQTFRPPAGERHERPPGSPLDCPDRHLRPLRDAPGADETLDWAAVPDPQVTRLLRLLHGASHG